MQLNPVAPESGRGLRTFGAGPLADPESPEEAVIMLLMQAGRRLRTRHPEDGVDPSTFPLAKQLLHYADGLRVSDLAVSVELDASTVSRQIKQLEDRGIVRRTPDPDDGRASLVQLTDEGRATLTAAFRRRFQRIQTVLEPWSAHDRGQLRDLLTRLAKDLGDASDQAVAEASDLPDPSDSTQESTT